MFTLRRSGEFFCAVVPNTAHCGLSEDGGTFRYEVEVCVDDDGLDQDGFVLDNAAIKAYFDQYSANPTSLSCELLAMQAAIDFHEALGSRCGKCDHICVRIWGLPTSHAEYLWERRN